ESFYESDLLFSEGINFGSTNENRSNSNIFAHQWHSELGSISFNGDRGELWKLTRGYGHRILNMDWLTLNNGSACYRTTINWYFRLAQKRNGSWMGCQSEHTSFDKSNHCIFCVTQPSGTPSNSVQHWLNIRRRAGDHTQYLARRGLLLQRFFKFL